MSDLSLRRHPRFPGVPGPLLVVVMDGVGLGRRDAGDAVHLARTPTLDFLAAHTPTTRLRAHGTAVGLPSDDDMGNSEVGHNALGAGRVFDQGAKLVTAAIESGALFAGVAWQRLVERVKASGEPLHFLGLLSDGNVHSHDAHLHAMIRRASAEGVRRVRVHALLDGRDVPATSEPRYLDALEGVLAAENARGDRDYRIASGGGRMQITMDRYGADWPMVERGWRTHVAGSGRGFQSAREAVATLRDESPGIGDQNLPAFVIMEDGQPVGPIRDGSSVIFFNFRGDRAIEITRAFEDTHFPHFDRGARPDVAYAGMMQYDGDLGLPRHFLVSPPAIARTSGEYLAHAGVTQFACSETQKFGHVTYFWNGNRSGAFDASRETYVEVPSDTRPFDERPWMKAAEVCDATIDALVAGRFRAGRINFANGDMVGHTGVLESSILAVEAVDLQLARLLPVVARLGGALVVTADHGNADEMFELDKKSGAPALDAAGRPKAKTSHSLNAVPFHVYAPGVPGLALRGDVPAPGLANVAATTLTLLGYEAPDDYAPSLLAL
jgi:2,3-bisphosphoglycerate-independent phosphoglycerate mutase